MVAPKNQKGFPRLTALCAEVGSDTQKPFEIVIVTGMISLLSWPMFSQGANSHWVFALDFLDPAFVAESPRLLRNR
jgi:hypothetical protein